MTCANLAELASIGPGGLTCPACKNGDEMGKNGRNNMDGSDRLKVKKEQKNVTREDKKAKRHDNAADTKEGQETRHHPR